MRESLIEAYLVKRVKAMGGEVRKVQWIGRRGAPDRLVMLPKRQHRHQDSFHLSWYTLEVAPKTIWVELKATGVKPEAHQLREHQRMCKLGQHVVVIDSLVGVDRLLNPGT